MPTVECFDRWYSSLLTLTRRAQTSGLLGSPDHRRIGTADRERAAFAASARVKASCRRYEAAGGESLRGPASISALRAEGRLSP